MSLVICEPYRWDPELALKHMKEHFLAWVKETNAQNFVVGLSGGKDSTIVAMFLAHCVDSRRIYGVSLPANNVPADLPYEIAKSLEINYSELNIGTAVTSLSDQIYTDRKKNGYYPTFDMEVNLPARIRMAALFAVGQCVNGRVINTSNLSEDVMGYATQFGDNAGCYAPLQGLTVTEVKALGKYLSKFCQRDLPLLNSIDLPPADGLQDKTDEERMGISYANIDYCIRQGSHPSVDKNYVKQMWLQNKFKLDIVQMPGPFNGDSAPTNVDLLLPDYVRTRTQGFTAEQQNKIQKNLHDYLYKLSCYSVNADGTIHTILECMKSGKTKEERWRFDPEANTHDYIDGWSTSDFGQDGLYELVNEDDALVDSLLQKVQQDDVPCLYILPPR